MPGIDKAKFLKRIAEKPPAGYGDSVPGEGPAEEMAPGEESDEGMTCGEQLMAAVKSGDAAGVDAALREAVAKYAAQ